MSFVKNLFLLVALCAVVARAFGATVEADPTAEEKPRGLFDDLFEGMDIKVDQFVSQGSKVIQKVSQSQTAGGQTITKTEITSLSSGNPAFRFKRDLFDDVVGQVGGYMDSMENKMETVHNKVAGAVSTGVNIVHGAKQKVNQALQH